MISCSLKNIKKILPYVSSDLAKALEYASKTDFSKMENGEYEIDGRNIFFRVNTYETEKYLAKKPESHFDYIDVQLISKGEEKIGYCDLTKEYKVSDVSKKAEDVVFYERTYQENFIDLKTGDLGIFFPWEVHRPGGMVGSRASAVQKVVIKVKAK